MTKFSPLLVGMFFLLTGVSVSAAELPPLLSQPEAAIATTPVDKTPFPESPAGADFRTTTADPYQAPSPVAENVAEKPAPGALWHRIRSGFAMPEIDSPLVARHQAWFLNHPDYFQRMIERSRLYLHFIVEEVAKRRMPMEIALLPMIESAFNPGAYSRAHAVGIWQFIPSTGRRYGLQQTWWYDGRRDVMAATGAALDYLEKLHRDFGDWQLALAAYNWGENGVSRAIARNRTKHKPTNYENLRMPRETRNYLPKLQAVKSIVANPELLNFPLEDVPDRPYFTTVTTTSAMDMKVAAQLAEMSMEEFRSLNPGHNRPVITSDGSRTLLLPVDKAGVFRANLREYDQPLVSWQTYTMKKKDSLESVARQFGIGTTHLKEINGIHRHTKVHPGRALLVPMNDDDPESNIGDTWNNPEFLAPEQFFGGKVFYRVRNGDTLYSIARRHRVSVAALRDWNRLRGNRIRVGQRLTLYSTPALARR